MGVPLGIALGRALWDLFARQISVVPEPTVPALAVVIIVVGALVIANLVALLPGRLSRPHPCGHAAARRVIPSSARAYSRWSESARLGNTNDARKIGRILFPVHRKAMVSFSAASKV